MLTDQTLRAVTWDGVYEVGIALCWVIGEDVLYDSPMSKTNSLIFTTHDQVIDISSLYPNSVGITVRFMKAGQTLGELNTSEYFGSILLSNPTVLDLSKYPYGRYVSAPYAKFINNSFVITDRDMGGLKAWY